MRLRRGEGCTAHSPELHTDSRRKKGALAQSSARKAGREQVRREDETEMVQ